MRISATGHEIDNHHRTRGSSAARRKRRLRLLSPEAGFGGDGVWVPCWECGHPVNYKTMVVDRKVPGCRGGTYSWRNIRPQCKWCADKQSDVVEQRWGTLANQQRHDRKKARK